MKTTIKFYFFIIALCSITTGCATYIEKPKANFLSLLTQKHTSETTTQSNKSVTSQEAGRSPVYNDKQTVHFYVQRLAEQFFLTSDNINTDKVVAIGTFLPIDQLSGNTLPEAQPLAYQIQESFITIAAQVGLNVIEFKTMSQIKIINNQDVMLSRQIEELNTAINADYFLTGNYIEHNDKLVVNARLIALPSRKVIAAATDYIPKDVMATTSAVMLKNNQLYRGVQ